MAAELVGGAVLSASLQVMFEKIGSHDVVDYLRGGKRCDLDGLLKKLKIMLHSLNAVLEDAEQKQFRNQGIKDWLDELQEAVYDAEDLLGEIEYDALRLKVEAESGTSTGTVSNFFSTIFNSTDREMKNKMEKILDRLEFIARQKDVLGLKAGVRERPVWRLPSTSLVEESGVYGRDDDKDAMRKLLRSDDLVGKEICVIPIVGMGGVGKTTLAQALFNDAEVQKHFEIKAWVCVSEEFDVCNVTKTILKAVTSRVCDATDLNSLQVKLNKRLTGKKFLVVLDDVWNERYTDWDVLKMPFKDGAQGSKIIVTTRSEKVASIMGTVPTHYVKELLDEASWNLFAKHAYGNGDFSTRPELERIGREIIKKCKGLPLAIKTLGGLLRSTVDVVEWERISKSDIWDLTDEQSNIVPALRLSYHYLPSHLKRCFAYCSIFPKDYRFRKDELICLWMADNLLEHRMRNKTIIEVGDKYFNELVARSFFQHLSTNYGSYFVMHDLMVDLAIFVYGKYYIHLQYGNSEKIVLTKQTRHLAFEPSRDYSIFNSVLEANNLRTFLPLNFYVLSPSSTTIFVNDLLKLRCLRFLSFFGFEDIKHLPDSISELKHIRHLDLSYTSINLLPDSISKLYNLRTLKLMECRHLTTLPKKFHHLINLRYLDVKGSGLVEMPTQISKLKNIQMLNTFIVGKDSGAKIEDLGEFSDLKGELSVENLRNVVNAKEALEAKLKDKKYLDELKLKWGEDTCDSKHERDLLENLFPNTALKTLKIVKYGGTKFPNWLGDQSFCNLVDLSLRNCKYCNILPPLGQLSSLKTLRIGGFDAVVTVGPEFYGNSSSTVKPFASLEFLEFDTMSNWEEWSMPDEDPEAPAFPKLKDLRVCNCKRLTGKLPCFLPFLINLIISGWPRLASSLPRLTGLHVVESFGSLQYLSISEYHESVKFRSLSVNLKVLRISGCENLEIPLHQTYGSLEKLTIENSCGSFGSIFPLNCFPKIRYLDIIGCKNLESLSMPEELCEGLMSLSSLYISKCPKFIFPSGGLLCPNLTELRIEDCDKLIASRRSWNLQTLPNLRRFRIEDWRCEDMESFPEEGLLPSTITSLDIYDLPCLKTLNNNRLQELTSLKQLYISNCPNLHAMSEEGLPTSIIFMRICGCPLLEEKCQKKKGEYWNKIAHIPYIVLTDTHFA